MQMPASLDWEAVFEIALALKERYPEVDLDAISLLDIFQWTISLPDFIDDPALANDEILMAIYQEWFEENNPLWRKK